MTSLTVVQVLPELDAGGVERGTLEVARALVNAGHRSLVISAGGRLVSKLREQGSEHLEWPVGRKSPLVLLQVSRLRRLLAERDAHILHARSRLPAWIAYLAWRRMPAPRPRFLTTAHGIYTVNPYSEIMVRGECVIAVSESVRSHLLEAYPRADAARLRVIHRGIDQAEFPRGHRPDEKWLRRWYEQFPELRDKRVITLPGRLSRLKGHREFFDLVAGLREHEPRVHGLVVGGEDAAGKRYARDLEREARARQLPVTFAGHREDMCDVYAASDVVLSLSQHPESFGRVVVEALSIGVPVIGYDHGGVGEVLATAFPQGRVPPGDARTLAQRCRTFLDAPPTTNPPVAFALDTMLGKTLDLYAEMARGVEARRGADGP